MALVTQPRRPAPRAPTLLKPHQPLTGTVRRTVQADAQRHQSAQREVADDRDDELHAAVPACPQMLDRTSGPREIDQRCTARKALIDVLADRDAARLPGAADRPALRRDR